jgi:hypothetical protein
MTINIRSNRGSIFNINILIIMIIISIIIIIIVIIMMIFIIIIMGMEELSRAGENGGGEGMSRASVTRHKMAKMEG